MKSEAFVFFLENGLTAFCRSKKDFADEKTEMLHFVPLFGLFKNMEKGRKKVKWLPFRGIFLPATPSEGCKS